MVLHALLDDDHRGDRGDRGRRGVPARRTAGIGTA
jgi:hypothetical protein